MKILINILSAVVTITMPIAIIFCYGIGLGVAPLWQHCAVAVILLTWAVWYGLIRAEEKKMSACEEAQNGQRNIKSTHTVYHKDLNVSSIGGK